MPFSKCSSGATRCIERLRLRANRGNRGRSIVDSGDASKLTELEFLSERRELAV